MRDNLSELAAGFERSDTPSALLSPDRNAVDSRSPESFTYDNAKGKTTESDADGFAGKSRCLHAATTGHLSRP
jgi:hypothetical protein